jgi:low affinity Fe/Cu permease
MHNDPVAHQSSLTARLFTTCATMVAHATGKPLAFAICLATVLLWAISGPMFGFSDTWQLVINTGTTIITFLMVFLIQNTQNRDGAAIQTKLDELIRSSAAQNRYIGIEHLTEEELEELRAKCETRAKAGKLHAARKAGERASEKANQKAARAARKAVSG